MTYSARLLPSLSLLPALFAGAIACSGDDGGQNPAASGGATGTGGAVGAGGGPGAGGAVGAGGSPSSGGAFGTGGGPGAGGGFGSGGGPGAGGAFGSGGGPGAGGSPGAGGGFPGSGGSEGDDGRSAGCGVDAHLESGRFSIMVNGKNREYTLDVPANYDPETAYPLTFGLHWRGGNSGDVVNNGYYGLKNKAAGGMIFVSPEGLVANGTSGWANEGGEDVEFVALMLDRFEAGLCIDTTRVFATGFSYGGMFSNAIACGLGDRFRAVAPYAGSLWSGCESGENAVAYLGTHGVQDSVVDISAGRQARDEFIGRNGCTTNTMPYGSNGCVEYQGCDEGYPLIWCEYSGDHGWPDFSDEIVWEFFSQF